MGGFKLKTPPCCAVITPLTKVASEEKVDNNLFKFIFFGCFLT